MSTPTKTSGSMVVYLCADHTLADALRDMGITNAVEIPTRAKALKVTCDAACASTATHTARITFLVGA